MRLILAAIFLASPAFAENPNWNGDPEPPAPPPVTVITPQSGGGSVYDPYSRVYFATCTCTEMRTAWGFETFEFREQAAEHQCDLRRERIGCAISDQSYAGEGLK